MSNKMTAQLHGEIKKQPGPTGGYTLTAWRAVDGKRYFSFAYVYPTLVKAEEAAVKYHVDTIKTEAELAEAAMDQIDKGEK